MQTSSYMFDRVLNTSQSNHELSILAKFSAMLGVEILPHLRTLDQALGYIRRWFRCEKEIIVCNSFLQEIEDFVLPDGLAITPRMVSKSINPYVASSLDNITTLGHWLKRYSLPILFLISKKLTVNFSRDILMCLKAVPMRNVF